MKKIISLLFVFLLLSSSITLAVSKYSVSDLKSFNFADVYLNGVKVLIKGTDTKTDKGEEIPSSILFKGTTYVPLKLLSQLLNLNVSWDGSVKLSSNSNESNSVVSLPIEKRVYSNKLLISNLPDYKIAYVETKTGEVIEGLNIQKEKSAALITNAYKLSIGQTYKLKLVTDYQIYEKEITLSNITLDSFYDNKYAWELIVPANSSKGYHHPFILRIPKDRSNPNIKENFNAVKNTILVEGSNEFLSNSNDEAITKVLSLYNGWYSSNIADRGNYISLMSLFPRPYEDGLLYTHSLDRDTLFGTSSYLNSLGRGNLYRIDKQYDAMISEGLRILNSLGKTFDDKVFLIGFSASSDFATRFNYTHPDRAKAVIVNSAPTLPLTEYKGFIMNFPLGMADISKVTGKPFDKTKFKSVPQFWHTGDKDLNDGSYFQDGWGNYGNHNLSDNAEGEDYRKLFGTDIVSRKALIEKILNEAGFNNITHKTYKGVEHGWNDEILKDALLFLEQHK